MGRWNDMLVAVKSTVGDSTDTEVQGWIVDAARRLNARAEYLFQDGDPIRITAPADWANGNPPLPDDFDDAIIHGAISTGLQRKDENLADAQWHDQYFQQGIADLKRRKYTRFNSGPVRIRVVGRDRC